MIELHLPWLEISILLPLAGAIWVSRVRDAELAQRRGMVFCALTLLSTVSAWEDFGTLHAFEAHDRWDWVSRLFGPNVFVIDELSAPLLPLAALLYLMTSLATLRTKVRRYSFAGALLSEAILIATLSCREPWGVIGQPGVASRYHAAKEIISRREVTPSHPTAKTHASAEAAPKYSH